MTSIRLYKSMELGASAVTYYITIHSAKVEETIIKNLEAKWSEDARKGKPIAVGASSQPIMNTVELLNVNRVFTITGTIDATSTDQIYCYPDVVHRPPNSAPEVRDLLSQMILYGGTVFFNYGLPGDVTGTLNAGYKQDNNNGYYTSTGFECHFNRIHLVEQGETGQYRNGGTYYDAEGKYKEANTVTFDKPGATGAEGEQGTLTLPCAYNVTIELFRAVDD